MVLTMVQSNSVADDPEDFALAYLLPTIFIAGSFVRGLAAAYFLYPPNIADPRHVAELGFILLLAVTASKAIGVLTDHKLSGSR
jgi:hypothetical protein